MYSTASKTLAKLQSPFFFAIHWGITCYIFVTLPLWTIFSFLNIIIVENIPQPQQKIPGPVGLGVCLKFQPTVVRRNEVGAGSVLNLGFSIGCRFFAKKWSQQVDLHRGEGRGGVLVGWGLTYINGEYPGRERGLVMGCGKKGRTRFDEIKELDR